jgi:hypothetical protein
VGALYLGVNVLESGSCALSFICSRRKRVGGCEGWGERQLREERWRIG